jgi:LacI family transcriptional regulator
MEVARLAGVSHQTVSRYLRFDGGMKEATRQRIGAAIAELDYRPNLLARAMRTRRTGRLAILLPAGQAVSSLEMLAGAAAVADDAGFSVEAVTLGGPPSSRAARVRELAESGLFEGVLSLTPLPAPLPRSADGVPVVVSADYDENMRGIGELADGSRIADLVERLARDGHRRFLHVAGSYGHTSAQSRKQVYLDTVQRLGLESYRIVDAEWSPEAARQAVLDLPRDSGVTAVVAANDVLAAGVVRGAWERGWRIPADLSVTGWNNEPWTAYAVPALSTVAVDHEALGRRAIARLIAVLRGDPEPDERTPVTRVVWRESVGPAPGAGSDAAR